jgi:hypothetical protein
MLVKILNAVAGECRKIDALKLGIAGSRYLGKFGL